MGKRNIFIAAGVATVIALLTSVLIGYRNNTVSANADSSSSKPSFLQRITSPRKQLVMVPAGSRIAIRLQQGISTERNRPGDIFTATLAEPLAVNGTTVAPAGTAVEGLLTDVVDSGRVEGRASLTMILRRMRLDGEPYTLSTEPLTMVARSTRKKDAKIIGGSAAAGALIGAIAGGGKGAAIGAAAGGGSGAGYVLATKGEPVAYGPETRFTFLTTQAMDLPVRSD